MTPGETAAREYLRRKRQQPEQGTEDTVGLWGGVLVIVATLAVVWFLPELATLFDRLWAVQP